MEDERWKSIELLSELRAGYSCFDEKEEPYYRALSAGIMAIREQIYVDNKECNLSEKPTGSESKSRGCGICHYNDGVVHTECVLCGKAESEDK